RQRRGGELAQRRVGAAVDRLVVVHVPVDGDRAVEQPAELLVEAADVLQQRTPVRQRPLQQRMTLAGVLAVLGERLLLDLLQRAVHVFQHAGDRRIRLGDVRDRLHGLDPARRRRRDFARTLVIFFYGGDGFAEAPVHGGEIRQLLLHRGL